MSPGRPGENPESRRSLKEVARGLARYVRGGGYVPLVLGVLYVLLFLPQIVYLATTVWSQEKYSHGWLIPVVSGAWVLSRRATLAAIPRRPANLGVALVVLGVLAWVYAQNKSYNALAHAAMLLTLAGIVGFCGGWRLLRASLFPLGYLVFAFPVPRRLDDLYVVLPLQRLAASVSERVIDALGVPVVREGNVLEVPGIRLFVEEACSGIHSLYSLMALGAALVFLFPWRNSVRVVLMISTLPIAILSNVVRVAGTGILSYRVSPKFGEGFSHFFAGLVVFVLGLGLFLGLAVLLNRWFPARGRRAS